MGSYDAQGKPNVMTIAWGGICCSKPPAVTVSLRKATYTYGCIQERGAYTVSIPSEKFAAQADYFGIASGRDTDKFAAAGLTARAALRQEAYNVTDPADSPLINRELAQRIGMNPFALAPLVVRGRTIGVIGIDRGRDNGAIQNEEFRILQVFANQAAITLYSLDPSAPAVER